MNTALQTYLVDAAETLLTDPEEKKKFISRVNEGKLTREENTSSHFCAMVLPYDPVLQKIFVIHHRKANLWAFPGGHYDKDELPFETAIRETEEELGIKDAKIEGPFGIQMIAIENKNHIRKMHYDIFYALQATPEEITPDTREFITSEWLSIPDAMERIEHIYYKQSLEKFVRYLPKISSAMKK
jgi:8-oxo-dGTP pyrophosphatase MutT (NUDIX family)